MDPLISSTSVCFAADLWIAQFVPWGNRKTIQQQSSNFRNGEKKVLHRILNSKYHDVTRAQNNHGNPKPGFEQAMSTRYPTIHFSGTCLIQKIGWKILVRLINYWLLFLESGVLGTKKSNIVTSKNCKNAPDTKYCGTCQIWEVLVTFDTLALPFTTTGQGFTYVLVILCYITWLPDTCSLQWKTRVSWQVTANELIAGKLHWGNPPNRWHCRKPTNEERNFAKFVCTALKCKAIFSNAR